MLLRATPRRIYFSTRFLLFYSCWRARSQKEAGARRKGKGKGRDLLRQNHQLLAFCSSVLCTQARAIRRTLAAKREEGKEVKVEIGRVTVKGFTYFFLSALFFCGATNSGHCCCWPLLLMGAQIDRRPTTGDDYGGGIMRAQNHPTSGSTISRPGKTIFW